MPDYDGNPFEDVALIFGDFICDRCGTDLGLPEGISFADDGWERSMGKRARELGWLAELNSVENDWAIVCPNCRRGQSA